MDLEKVGPELTTAAQCMRKLSWLTLVIVVIVVVLLVSLLSGNNQLFWVLVGSAVGATLLFWVAGGTMK